MDEGGVSFWTALRVKLHLATKLEADRYLQAVWLHGGAPVGALVGKAALGGAILASAALSAYLSLPFVALGLNGFRGLVEIDLGKGKRTAPEILFSAETKEHVQRLHDRWQELYGDRIYRKALKPRAVSLAVWDYIGDVLRFRTVGPPRDWARKLSHDDVEGYTRSAESGWRALKFNMDNPQYYQYRYTRPDESDPFSARAFGDLNDDGVTSTFQLSGQVTGGVARTAPSIGETEPEE